MLGQTPFWPPRREKKRSMLGQPTPQGTARRPIPPKKRSMLGQKFRFPRPPIKKRSMLGHFLMDLSIFLDDNQPRI